MTHRSLFPPPDENRALEQLERFHREILRARRDRERASAEFEGFVQEMQGPAEHGTAPAPPVERAVRRAPRPIVPGPDRPAGEPAPRPRAESPAPTAPPVRASESITEPIPALAAPSRSRWGFLALAIGLLVGAASAFYFLQRSSAPIGQPQTAAPAAVPQAPSSAAAGPATPARPSPDEVKAATPPAVSSSTVRLVTDRPVWMRVIVDGEKVLERELPAGQTLTYTPTALIVVRAGDAGGVRVTVGNGPEEVLGRDAFPATRRFQVPQR